MARPPKNHLAAEELGRRLSDLAKPLGEDYSPKKIERWLLVHFGAEVSDEHIRQAHKGTVDPTTCSVDLLAGLAAYYDVELEALGRFAAERTQRVLAMAGRVGSDPRDPAGQVTTSFPCMSDDLAERRSRRVLPVLPARAAVA